MGQDGTTTFINRRFIQQALATVISLACVIFLLKTADWREALRVFRAGASAEALLWFALLAVAVAAIYGIRWRLLVGPQLGGRASLAAALLGLGGNMFLPARGGDLLRVHYTHKVAGIGYAEAVGKLLVEKVIDLVTIISVGILAVLVFNRLSLTGHLGMLLGLLTGSLIVLLAGGFALRMFEDNVISLLRPLFHLMRLQDFFERHIVRLVQGTGSTISLSVSLAPALLTFAMWLLVYAPAYMLVAKFVGVALPYRQALFVLFAGAVGLMIPAAPSGVGTFHASVVSAFVFLGRPAAQGLLLAMAIHFLFFVAYVVPGGIILARWRLTHFKPKVSA
jgi:uncharacterized protein (TIRG00374 family)